MSLLDRSAILGAPDLPHEDVPVKEWGGTVRVRTMTGAERDEFRSAIATEGGVLVGAFSASLLAATLVDEQGTRLFTAEDVAQLLTKNATALDAAANVAMRLNGLGVAANEDAVKN